MLGTGFGLSEFDRLFILLVTALGTIAMVGACWAIRRNIVTIYCDGRTRQISARLVFLFGVATVAHAVAMSFLWATFHVYGSALWWVCIAAAALLAFANVLVCWLVRLSSEQDNWSRFGRNMIVLCLCLMIAVEIAFGWYLFYVHYNSTELQPPKPSATSMGRES